MNSNTNDGHMESKQPYWQAQGLAEKQARSIGKLIVFDRSRRLRWQKRVARPAFEGVAGLFAESLGYPELIP